LKIYAEEFLDARKNLMVLNEILKNVKFNSLDQDLKLTIIVYEKQGFKKFREFYLKFYFIFDALRKIRRK